MEASALSHASRAGLLVRRSPLVRLQGDERLIAMIRDGQAWAFEALWDRYQARLLAFCRNMLPSEQDAEDVLQDVFVSAHKAILADNRQIKVKPWLYRIARNRCLNHLRRPVHEGSDEMMDEHPFNGGTTTAEQVQTRQELREVLVDVEHLPETQRTALLLREADALSYAEIAQAMETTIPAVKSLLVRARITLAESSQARQLTCGEVQLELAEAAEGIAKASGPVRQHVKACEQCKDFRGELRSSSKALAALFPLGPFAVLKEAIAAKLGGAGAGSATSGGGASAGGAAASGAGACGGAAAGGAGASGMAAGGALGGAAAAGGGAGGIGGSIGVIGGAIGTKAAAGVATAAIAVAGAVEVNRYVAKDSPAKPAIAERSAPDREPARGPVTMSSVAPVAAAHAAKPASEEPAPSQPTSANASPSDAPPSEPAPAESAPASAPPPASGSEDSDPDGESPPPSDQQGGVVTATGTHEGPVTTTPAPSGSLSGSSQPPPSNASPPVPQGPAPTAPVVEVVPAGS